MNDNSLVNSHLGKYIIQAEIGRGGMGAVYLAYDPDLERHVAIKVLAPHLAWQKESVDRFLREARAAARLKHPGIVTIHDVGQQGEWYYFVMEYLEGQALTEIIRQRGPLSTGEALTILRPLAGALDYAHRQGLIHRDIKPGNIIVSPEGAAKLTDFGIARVARDTRLTSTGAIMGTPEYMSPEQAQGLKVDARSDQYSLAVVAYEMLSGLVPFRAESTMALLYMVTHEPPPPISRSRPDLPRGVEAVLERALAKRPEVRFDTLSALVGTLEQAFQGKTIKRLSTAQLGPRQAPLTRRLPAWGWGLGALATLVLVVSLVLVMGGGGGGGRIVPTSPPQPTAVAAATSLPTFTPDARATNAAATVIAAAMTVGASTASATQADTATSTATATLTATSAATPSPTGGPNARATPTRTPTVEPSATPTSTPTPGMSATPSRTPTTGGAAATNTSTAQATSPPASGALINFEQFGNWRRGDQPYGELTQTQEQIHSGSYAAKLSYNFPTVQDDFVVFIRPLGLSGQPNKVGAWVYGDGTGHFFNVWIQDAEGEIWQFTLGRIWSRGWQQMVGNLDPRLSWPNSHISGPDNGVLDYPISFYALVLDRADGASQNGQVYIDDISVWRGDISITPTPAAATPTPGGAAPTSTPGDSAPPSPPDEIGHIVFTVKAGDSYYLYSTDPAWSQMKQIGPTDWAHSTCSGATVSTLEGFTLNLYGKNQCYAGGNLAVCDSPDGQYKVVVQPAAGGYSVALVRASDNQIVYGYYQGPLNGDVGIVWSFDSRSFLFTVGQTVNVARIDDPGYTQVVPEIETSWPPQFVPYGAQVYYLKPVGSEGAVDIFVINLDGTGPRNLTNAPSTHKLCPRWKP